jgi:MFS family permease
MRKSAIAFIVLLGLVSLFADVTYEGARSIAGPFLSTLGASGAVVGIVVGLGELVGYGLRAFFGYLADKTKFYWTITFVGYAINLFAVPLLALAGNWQVASFLIIVERFGKAIRVPSRDAMLSYATKQTGRGWGFGLHEALDQIGAVTGPIILTIFLAFKESYRFGFAMLLIPAILALCFLTFARNSFPRPHELEVKRFDIEAKGLKKSYWIYIAAISLVAAGYVDFALISYHFQQGSILKPTWIPFFYAIAMAVSGISSLFMGRWYDKKGISVLAIITAFASLFAPLVFWGNFPIALLGMILWGIGIGSQESIMRAVVPSLAPPEKRASAYGVLNLFFGVFWALGSAIMGVFYDISFVYLVLFSIITQFASIPFLLKVKLRLS